ncbi:MAG TPA: N-acetyltransferase [Chromatiales bacterium]|nr:N-acetyltransferase [Chromatiales bacterium]
MEIRAHTGMEEIPAGQWNALLTRDQPFVRHEFLHALEAHGCVGQAFGWLPRHVTVSEGGRLVGALPLYEKYNTFGEFVFDHALAQAYGQVGLRYYPKLVCAVPYTPVCGPRLLARAEDRRRVYPVLLQAARQMADAVGASGLHFLFPEVEAQDWLEGQSLLVRHDCQFHWHNRGYSGFEDFLSTLSAKKRKNIRRERRIVAQAGIRFQRLDGHAATGSDWKAFARFYRDTFESKGSIAPLNEDFFRAVARAMPDRVLLVLARRGDEIIAASLMWHDDEVLYGRYWGSSVAVDSLHFETCYYQGIEYCIERGLRLFEPGAQGEHKIARGFSPVLTRSSHWLRDTPLLEAIRQYMEREREAVRQYMRALEDRLPYRRAP